jgi:hypothetical protein
MKLAFDVVLILFAGFWLFLAARSIHREASLYRDGFKLPFVASELGRIIEEPPTLFPHE